nr:RHS repeat-associated core domain-containing protein [Dickeya fangzhongdai]
MTDLTGTARELCSETGEVHWRGEQGLWGAYREDKRPIPLRRYLGDAANEEVYCELRYQGQVYDAETGLYYNRHRYFDPELGQYLSADPLGILGGIRPQGYVHNPLELVDPLGLVGDPANSTHITYQGVKNGKPYVGYASKPGLGHSAQDVLNYRYGNNFDAFDVKPEPFYRGDGLEGKYTARGLEQRTFEDLGGLEGTSNKQNPIGQNNPRRDDYLAAADNHRTKGDKCP